MGEAATGLARDIRAAVASEQFDLGGYTEVRVTDLVNAAFSSPLTAPSEMIRFTFVVGGGKLVRARYPDDLSKWMTNALTALGFTEDRSAAVSLSSQGQFKRQHDTGQNLKYLVVFPHVDLKKPEQSTVATEEKENRSPEFLVTSCTLARFQEMVASKVQSWRQKKRLSKLLQDRIDEGAVIEKKLIKGGALTPQEQAAYESNTELPEKSTWLQTETKKMVDAGTISSSEKAELLELLQTNLDEAGSELAAATTANQPKKVAALNNRIATVKSRIQTVEKINATKPPPLKHSAEIQKLWQRTFKTADLEEKGKTLSLTIADLKLLEERRELEARIKELEQASRGWFQEDADFLALCSDCHRESKQTKKSR